MLRLILGFLGHLRGRECRLLTLFALGLAASATSLASPLVGKAFIDAVATRKDFAAVPPIAAALVGLAVLDLALGAVVRLLHTRLSTDLLNAMRERLFARCVGGPLDRLETFRHGDLLCRFGTDVPQVQTLLVDGLVGGVQNLLFLAVAAGILVRLSAPMALWSFAGVLAALGATAAFRRAVEARTEEIRQRMATLSHFLSERLGALRPIRLHRTGEEEARRLRELNAGLGERVVSFQWFDTLASGLPGLSLTLGLAWIYVLGGRYLETGEIGLGTFVAFVLYQGRLYGPARGLLGFFRSLQESKVSLRRVAELELRTEASEAPAERPAPRAGAPEQAHVRFEGLGFAYPGKPAVLRDLTLSIERGEHVALFGPSGAGKSTLVQLLFGLREPSLGSVTVEGVFPGDLPAGAVGYAGAEPFLLHATVRENIAYARPGASAEEVARAARLADAHDFIAALPEGYATVIGGRGLALSDGQRQRLGLARLFLQDPSVLVLDEAFCALDLETEARVRRNLWEAFGGRTVLSISHRLTGLEEFDTLYLLRDGRVEPVAPDRLRALLLPGPGGDVRVAEPSSLTFH